MWPFRKKTIIKNEKKIYPYSRMRGETSYNDSAWDGLSIIEKFVLIVMPCMLCFMAYKACEVIFGFVWWLNLIISIGITTLVITIIYLLSSWLVERDY